MKDETANSNAILREAVAAIREKFPDKTVGQVVTQALIRHAHIGQEHAEVIGRRTDHLIAEKDEMRTRQDKQKLLDAVAEVYVHATIDYSYDIPALAGYAKDSALKIYFDLGLKREWKLSSGKVIDITPYLLLHEVVEKCLLLEVPFSTRAYQRAHQIAQRLEQEAVRADGISWKEYQYTIMVPEADRAYTKPVLSLPPDLDRTPYEDLEDEQILEMTHGDFFTSTKIGPGIFHLHFESATRMASAMMRFQEYYESPKFRGTYFTREEFMIWYSQEKNGATYAQNWAEEGFNIPSSVLEPFYEGHFSPLTADESYILDIFRFKRATKIYIIATAKDSRKGVIHHEIAHALYYLNPEYKKEVDSILASIDTAPIKHFLTTNPDYAAYHEAILDDEIHAYLGHSSDELAEHGIDLAPYAETIRKFQELYTTYAPSERG
jgi:hypothetical protein